MWYNGTELSAKARRALENETVTIVTHNTGYIHTIYPAATIDRGVYGRMKSKLTKFLSTDITYEILANFLRHNSGLQKHFQISHPCHGKTLYIEAEKVYSYEHSSKLRVGDGTQENLLQDIEDDEFYTEPRPNRFDMGKLEVFLRGNKICINSVDDVDKLKSQLANGPVYCSVIIDDLIRFCHTVPVMPDEQKEWTAPNPISLDGVKCAEDAREALKSLRGGNETVDLAFMAFRDLSSSPWKPFLKAAVERNPVCLTGANSLTLDDAYTCLTSLPFSDISIYDDRHRLAQPDEVWNYKRGDGLEKAIMMASIYINRQAEKSDISDVAIDIGCQSVKLSCGKQEFIFDTNKNLAPPVSDDWARF
jgi:hypothetical protein